MYPPGHFALGYFAGLIIGRITKEEFNIPLIWVFSMIPDIDFFFAFLEHRGPTHSIIIAIVVFLPLIIVFRRGWVYFAALASHSLIGDYFNSYGCRLFWPLFSDFYHAPSQFILNGEALLFVEQILFTAMILVILSSYIIRRSSIQNPSTKTLEI